MKTPAVYLGRKAAKATVKHVARGTAAKTRRKPLRAVTLLGVGGAVGGAVGWFAAHQAGSSRSQPPS